MMRKWSERFTNPQDAITSVVAVATAMTGFCLLASHNSLWLWIPAGVATFAALVILIRRREKPMTILRSLLITIVMLAVLPRTFPVMALVIQMILFAMFLFPLAWFWDGSNIGSERGSITLIFGLVIAICAFCAGVGYLVTDTRAAVWLILGLWLIAFPKGMTNGNLKPLAGLVGLAGLGLVIAAVLSGWIPRNSMLLAGGLSLLSFLVVSIASLVTGGGAKVKSGDSAV